MIFDSHAHYDDESFDEDREALIEEIKKNRVVNVLNCGASLEGAEKSLKLAKKYSFFYAAVGIHPENAYELTEDAFKRIEEMTKDCKVKAIGEIGLDYYWKENPPKEVQKEIFRKQMNLAKKLNLPVVIHDREAHGDTLEIIKEFPGVKGVVHCFSGSVEFARECLKLGYYIGFTGVVTFKNPKKIVDVAKEVPLNKMLVETDAPYMAPVPNRGKRNRSDYIKYVIDKIAEIKGVSTEEIEKYTENNAKILFNINE